MPIDGLLEIGNFLIIYNDGYYSLDGGITTSTDTIGPQTQIYSQFNGPVLIQLQNASPVNAKLISIRSGGLTIIGPGEIILNNQDVLEISRIYGIRVYGNITINGGATVRSTGFTDGITSVPRGSEVIVTGGSVLYGECTGINANITDAPKYGVFSGGSIAVSQGSRIDGVGVASSYGAYGIFCDNAHVMSVAMDISSDSQIVGNACIGVYVGGPTIVDGVLTGNGGSLNVAHGIQGDRAGISVGPGAVVTGTAQGVAYAGILMVYGYTINGGEVTGVGGIYGVRSASSGSIVITDGTLVGTGNSSSSSYGVYVLNENLAASNSRVTGTGGRGGVFAGGDIDAIQNSTVEGFTYAYGLDSMGYYGAVIARDGIITATDSSRIIENYSRVEYYDEAYKIPYQDGKNMTSYLDYLWGISSGTGAVASDPGGAGIYATQSGEGILTAMRTGNVAGEVVELDANSTHIINIPVELTTSDVPVFSVTYDGNGSTDGNVPIDLNNPYNEGDIVTVLGNVGNLTRPGYVFIGWTMNPDGSGVVYRQYLFYARGRCNAVCTLGAGERFAASALPALLFLLLYAILSLLSAAVALLQVSVFLFFYRMVRALLYLVLQCRI